MPLREEPNSWKATVFYPTQQAPTEFTADRSAAVAWAVERVGRAEVQIWSDDAGDVRPLDSIS